MTLRYAEGDFVCQECGSTRMEYDEALRGGFLSGTANFDCWDPLGLSATDEEEHVDVSVFETQTKQGVKAYEARHTHLADLSRRRWRRTVTPPEADV
ncbi:unnamed protein product [Symbiodinium necroappetens]|uniref:Uncharacterized protein n=1 Tax=Symbiodinium necroappetens TaxID=1628268 RepID=A0A813C4M5_9DINO|nr:unnamed protein product [Symbiodinium necroappetens]